jgi:hypothetical protein
MGGDEIRCQYHTVRKNLFFRDPSPRTDLRFDVNNHRNKSNCQAARPSGVEDMSTHDYLTMEHAFEYIGCNT